MEGLFFDDKGRMNDFWGPFWDKLDLQQFVPLAAAIFLGGLIGTEREIHKKPAGLRTNTLICLGAALLTMIARNMAEGDSSTRIIQGIITGVGFIGAGAIMRDQANIYGVTTAATIWIVTVIGIACGYELYRLAVFTAVLSLLILLGLGPLDRKIQKHSENGKTSPVKGVSE